MDNTELPSATVSLPFYLKLSQIVMGIGVFFYIMVIGQSILIPLIFSTLFAIVLNPFVNFLCKKHFNRVLAIAVALFVGIILIFGLFYFLSTQASIFTKTFPQFKVKFSALIVEATNW